MTPEPGDAQARGQALDPARSFIVQAPAGSGKTGLLTQRFLRLLALVDAPEQIVAITFTRKAAAEMRRRVVLALRGVEPGHEARGEHDQRTRALAGAARARAIEKEWSLERNPARLRIHTIDAFCHSLAAQSPVLARAGAELQVTDDARDLYRTAARRTLARVSGQDATGAAVATLLLHRDVQVPDAERHIVEMLGRRDQWLPVVFALQGRELRERLERDLAREVRGHLRSARALMPDDQLERISRLLAGAAERRDSEHLASWRGSAGPPAAELSDWQRWRSLAAALLTEKEAWRKRVNVNDGFSPMVPIERGEMETLLAELAGAEALRRELSWLRKIPPARFSEQQWRTVEALITVLKLAAAELELVFRETGQVDHPAVLNAAVHALGSAEAPSELALSLDRRIRHLLVDEYQDTSTAQFHLLQALTAEWSADDGRTVFCVGDPMQSIYRFRQAEVGLFLRTRERGLNAIALQPLRLQSNFRSQRGLVDWFNRVFASVLPAADDIARGAVSHVPSATVRASLVPAVRVHPAFTPEAAVETYAMLRELEAIRERHPDATIGVLARHRAHVANFAAALRERGIPFQAVELEALASRPVVRDLLALARALLHEGDRVAWLSILRSPVCGLTLADLEALTRDAPQRTMRELLGDPEVTARLSADGTERAARARAALESALDPAGAIALGRRVESLWLTLGGPAVARDDGALEDAASFFDHLRLLQERGGVPAGDALEAEFAELHAEPDPRAPARLQVMTVHKAKGLEFDVVLLPGLGRGRARHSSPLLHWLEVAQVDGPAGLLLAPIARKGSDGDPHARYVADRQRECSAHESARLLYVAATRARRELHLFGHVGIKEDGDRQELGGPESGSPLLLLWHALRPEFEAAFAARIAAPATDALRMPQARVRRHQAGWTLPAPPAAVGAGALRAALRAGAIRPEFEWASEVSRHVGSAVHAELDRWSRGGVLPDTQAIAGSRARFQRMLAALGVPAHERAAGASRVADALARTLEDERGRWLFAADHVDVRSEWAVSGSVSGEVVDAVIDRTFVDAQRTRWIIDFKTSSHEGGALDEFLDNEVRRYREQLARYAALLKADGEPVRVGLYFPMLGGWREWDVR